MDTARTPAFQLSLLGPFELSGPDGPVHLTSKKLAALLAFLACTAPQPHSRDKLMTLLWGSHFDTQARQNLRQALTRLRRVLGEDALVSSGESVFLQPGAIVCDVGRFEALLAGGSREALDRAVGLYRGALLANFSMPEEAWTEWLGVQRQRLEGLALDAMVRLGEQELQSGNHEQALRAASRATNSTCLSSAAFTYGVLSYRFEEAFEMANWALMVHPNSLFVRNRTAAVYLVCGESDKAIAQCEAACRMNPLDTVAAFLLAATRSPSAPASARWYSPRR